MKKLLVLALMAFGFSTMSVAQNARLQEKIKSMRIAFFTEQLALTPDEAQAFWPIYNEYEAERKKLKGDYDLPKNLNQLTDEQAEAAIVASLEMEEKEVGLKRTYIKKLQGVLPAQKIAKLQRAERLFKEKILQIINERRKKNRQKRRNGGK
ncbi:MAG: hypothetical protein AAGD05_06430 [Bacteroidota bacterium]